MLALPPSTGAYSVDTDALDKLIGFVLFQKQPTGTDRTKPYWSCSINEAMRTKERTHGEHLAGVWALLPLQPYLEGSPFGVRTDHDRRKWVLNLKDSIGQLAHWQLRLSEIDLDVVPRTA